MFRFDEIKFQPLLTGVHSGERLSLSEGNMSSSGSLGFLRRSVPGLEGSRGRYARRDVREHMREVRESRDLREPRDAREAREPREPREARPRGAQSARHDEPEPRGAQAARPDEREQLIQELRRPDRELEAVVSRVDRLDMKLNTLENSSKNSEQALVALRDDCTALSKACGGRAADRTDAVGQQLKTLEDSFCDYSARTTRAADETHAGLLALKGRVEQLAVCPVPPLEPDALPRLEPLQAEHNTLAAQHAALRSEHEALKSQHEALQARLEPLQAGLAKLDALEARLATLEPLCARVVELEQQASADEIQKLAFQLPATVLSERTGLPVDASVQLQHPVTELNGTSYMRMLQRDSGSGLIFRQVPVQDETGQLVRFSGTVAEPAV